MSRNSPKHKLPRKLSAAMDLGPYRVGRVETDADDPSGRAHTEPAQSANRSSRRGRPPQHHPRSEASYMVGYGRPPKHTQLSQASPAIQRAARRGPAI